jgi:hypothetical protein
VSSTWKRTRGDAASMLKRTRGLEAGIL